MIVTDENHTDDKENNSNNISKNVSLMQYSQ